MRAVLQSVTRARVFVDGIIAGEIKKGFLLYLGVEKGDGFVDIKYIADKVRFLRIFADVSGRMNLDVMEAGGSVLVVSQFTLLADCRKGRRPGFSEAEAPEKAEEIYNLFITLLGEKGLNVSSGCFGAHMEIDSLNDGPVTMLLNSRT